MKTLRTDSWHVFPAFPITALAVILAIILLSPLTSVADSPSPAGTPVLWPSRMDGWKIAEGPVVYDRKSAYTYMDGSAELFIAFNMETVTVVRYESAGRPAIVLEVYRMGSTDDAYGLFTFESDDPAAGIGQGSEFGGGLLRFYKGYYFVSVYGDGTGADVEAATLSIGRYVADAITETGKKPAILDLLPDGESPYVRAATWLLRSHILLNQRFSVSRKNILNLAADTEAVLARYESGKEKVHLLLVKYPDRARADSAFSGFKAEYAPDGGSFPRKTGNNKWVAAGAYGRYVLAIFDAPDETFATKMLRNAAAPLDKEARQ